ncbi:MAG: hypothetical protein V1495_07655 [Pseudomonadota bacterium]
MTKLQANVLLFGLLFSLLGCAQKNAPTGMRHEEIRSTQQLKIGLIDFGAGFDRRGIDGCADQFPKIEVVGEPALVSSLRKEGIYSERLLEWGSDFGSFRSVRGFHILFLTFELDGRTYLRSVNYLRQSVSTVVLDVKSPSCEELLRKERMVVVESHPQIADVGIGERKIGEAPVWVWLRPGDYKIDCILPEQIFKPVPLKVPGTVRVLCQRENSSAVTRGADQPEEMTGEEKAGSVLVYIVGGAASIAAILLPILFFL